jgi:succinyl-CoA synthetase beta subunit
MPRPTTSPARSACRTPPWRRRAACCKKLYTCFWETDASLAEINPLILEGNGNIKALDAKMNFDSNALFRHEDIVAMRDLDEEDPAEIEASKFDLSYISLDGNIGCLVNGAGLAMATMDTIKLFGAEPANFLDVGGGATTEKVTEAFKIMLKNPKVKGILVNIFGGIMKCDTIATGVVAAARCTSPCRWWCACAAPTRTSASRSSRIPACPSFPPDDMADAAQKIVARRQVRNQHEHSDQQEHPVVTQGITGKTGQFHTKMCRSTPTARTATSPA